MKVSICIPTYNLAQFIEKAIMSCINQTMDNDDYEIIIVDDCSTDDTLKIAKEVFENNNFKNFTIEKLESNSGNASMPRNRAIDLAKGEYIYFVDGDDFLYPEALERMYAIGKKNNSDIIAGKYKGINRGVPEGMFRTGVDKDEAEIIEDRIMWAMSVQKMFKLEELRRLGTKFDPTLVIGEDVQFFIEVFANTEKMSVISSYYCYALVGHDGDHLSKRRVDDDFYIKRQLRVIDTINKGTCLTDDQKARATAKFITRIVKVGSNSNMFKPTLKVPYDVKAAWLSKLSYLLNETLTEECNQYITVVDYNLFTAIKANDVLAVANSWALADVNEKLNAANNKIKKLEEVNNELSRQKAEQDKLITSVETMKQQLSKLKVEQDKTDKKVEVLQNKVKNLCNRRIIRINDKLSRRK